MSIITLFKRVNCIHIDCTLKFKIKRIITWTAFRKVPARCANDDLHVLPVYDIYFFLHIYLIGTEKINLKKLRSI